MKTKFFVTIIMLLFVIITLVVAVLYYNGYSQNTNQTTNDQNNNTKVDPRYFADEKFCLIDSDCEIKVSCDICNCPDGVNKYTPQPLLTCPTPDSFELCKKCPFHEFKCVKNKCTLYTGN
ncbi:MAG: hypothetical protein WA063_01125 [Minisyncoccia bacterium]